MPRCYISLGGNLGTVADAFNAALDRLAKVPGNAVVAVSRYLGTEPVGDRAGGNRFLNAVAEIDTKLPPLQLLDLLQSIELDLGRTRTIRWGPRTLDLDLLHYGSEIIDLPRLLVPHPAAWYRRFVLDPLVEIAPRLVHPVKQADIQTLRQRLLGRPLIAALAGGGPETRSGLILELGSAFPDVNFLDWEGIRQPRSGLEDEPALTFWLGLPVDKTVLPGNGFEQLPLLSRIDATTPREPVEEFVRHVLQSALG